MALDDSESTKSRRHLESSRSGLTERNAMRVVLEGVAIVLITATVLYFARATVQMRLFMESGKRFTQEDGLRLDQEMKYLRAEIAEHREEDKRLQRQIDRLEGETFRGKRMPDLPPYSMRVPHTVVPDDATEGEG